MKREKAKQLAKHYHDFIVDRDQHGQITANRLIPQGQCACGKIAHMLRSHLLAPGVQTEPEPICDECNQREMEDMVRRVENMTREEALSLRKYFK